LASMCTPQRRTRVGTAQGVHARAHVLSIHSPPARGTPVLTGSPRHHDGQGNRHPRIACAFSVQRGKHMLRKGGCAQSCRDRCLHSSPPICEAKILMQIMSLQIVLVLLLLHLQLRAHGRGHVCQGAIVT